MIWTLYFEIIWSYVFNKEKKNKFVDYVVDDDK